MTDRIYIEGHRPAMGWFEGAGFVASCDCGWVTGPQSTRAAAEKKLQVEHLADMETRHAVIIEQEAVEAPDDEWGGF